MAGSYTVAQAIVEALEREGIVGTQVEVISGAADDVSSLDNSAADHRPSLAERIRNAFRSHSHPGDKAVHDYYVEDPEFYASHVRQGRALIIVRMPDAPEADRAAEVLRLNDAFDPKGGNRPRIMRENNQPGVDLSTQDGAKDKTIGDESLTTGGTRADLEGRGANIRQPR